MYVGLNMWYPNSQSIKAVEVADFDRWSLVKNVSQLFHACFSAFQIEEFRRLRTHVKGAELLEGCDGILGDNFRPTQPLSDRIIRAAFQ